jgi:hypothetical protein
LEVEVIGADGTVYVFTDHGEALAGEAERWESAAKGAGDLVVDGRCLEEQAEPVDVAEGGFVQQVGTNDEIVVDGDLRGVG